MIAVIGVIVSILIQGIVSGWMDVLSIYICPLGAGLAGIMLFWVCGKEYVEKQVNKGRSSHLTSWFTRSVNMFMCRCVSWCWFLESRWAVSDERIF